MSEKLWYLKRCNLFERLPSEELVKLESRARLRIFSKKSPVYLPSDEAQGVLLLTKGRVKICHLTPEGKQAILAFIEPGEVFGELAIFSDTAREEYAEATEASSVLLLANSEIARLMATYGELTIGITKLIGLRRRRIERRLKSLLYQSNRERLTSLLLELADQYGRAVPEGLLLDIKLSHQDLASIIGSARETVTVVLGELQAEGKLTLGRRKIILTQPEALAASVLRPPPRNNEGNSHPKLSGKAFPV